REPSPWIALSARRWRRARGEPERPARVRDRSLRREDRDEHAGGERRDAGDDRDVRDRRRRLAVLVEAQALRAAELVGARGVALVGARDGAHAGDAADDDRRGPSAAEQEAGGPPPRVAPRRDEGRRRRARGGRGLELDLDLLFDARREHE